MSENAEGSAPDNQRHFHLKEGAFIFLAALCLLLFLALGSYDANDPGWNSANSQEVRNLMGPLGALIADVFFTLFGYTSFLLPALIAYRVLMLFLKRELNNVNPFWLLAKFVGLLLIFVSVCGLFDINVAASGDLPAGPGGMLGLVTGSFAEAALNVLGARLVLIALFLFSFTVFTNISWLKLMDQLGGLVINAVARVRKFFADRKARKQQQEAIVEKKREREVVIKKHVETVKAKPKIEITKPKKPEQGKKVTAEKQTQLFPMPPEGDMPNLELLNKPPEDFKRSYSDESLEAMSRLLEVKLAEFNVSAEVTAVLPGPVITRFEIQPAAGTKASKITGIAQDCPLISGN